MKLSFTWEFGGGMGHLSEILPLALECSRRGHDVSLVLKSLRNLEHFLGDSPIRYFQAPTEHPSNLQKFPVTANYSQLLHNLGFGDPRHLRHKATAWRNLFEVLTPDRVVCDHAPIAMLALRSLGIPYVSLGTGFMCPPTSPRLPVLRTDYEPPPPVVAFQSTKLVEHANRFLTAHQAAPLERLEELFPPPERTYLATYRELDHFPDRAETKYWGSWPLGIGGAPKFPSGNGVKVFGYLKPFKALPSLLLELNKLKIPTLICGSGIPEATKARMTSETLWFSDGPVELSLAFEQCDFALLNATHGVMSAALMAGKPVLNIPIQLEQALLAKTVTWMKAGISAAAQDAGACVKALHVMLQKRDLLTSNAEAFAAKYRTQDAQQQISELVTELEKVSAA